MIERMYHYSMDKLIEHAAQPGRYHYIAARVWERIDHILLALVEDYCELCGYPEDVCSCLE
jgi:hypothetical protein